jgi:uncharacterized protein (DUF1778 family)
MAILTSRWPYADVKTRDKRESQKPVMSSVLRVRLSGEERALLEAASSRARMNVSEFVRRTALEAAERNVLERGIVTIPNRSWERFEAWIARPGRKIAGLKDLARRPPTWRG